MSASGTLERIRVRELSVLIWARKQGNWVFGPFFETLVTTEIRFPDLEGKSIHGDSPFNCIEIGSSVWRSMSG
jgi:hypothetical protein